LNGASRKRVALEKRYKFPFDHLGGRQTGPDIGDQGFFGNDC
jgi:hypothetical protein